MTQNLTYTAFCKHILATLSVAFYLLAVFAITPALALEAGDHDAFYIGGGSANLETTNGEILSGSNAMGGVRIGLFSGFFMELGYGSFGYRDTIDQAGLPKDITTQAFGPHYGGGFVFQVRKLRLGMRMTQSFNNRWTEEIKDKTAGTIDSRQSGRIDYDSYYGFTQFGENGTWEIGIRRDMIRENTSIITNSFGPYIMFNITTASFD